MSNLNSVETSVTIAGKACHFVHLKLNQYFNLHHTFEIRVDYSELDTLWMANPIKMIRMIGQDVGITMQHKQTGEMNLFSGVITNVAMSGQHGEQNYIVVSGCSPTIKLDGTPTMDSFIELDLKTIVEESIANSGNGAEVVVKPVFKERIDYLCQYNESCFEFLNRLSYLYGEWFGYDGTKIFFGKPDPGKAATITYDQEITYFDFSASLVPPKVNRYDYLTHQTNEVNSSTPDRVIGVRGYIKVALDESKKAYPSDATRPLEASILSKKALDDLIKVDKYRMVSQMLTMRGQTQTCKVKIAKLINVQLPAKMEVDLKHVETFLVTQVTHEADQDGTYFNTFTAIPSEMENIPMTPIKAPIALPQVAWVKSNADPRGRGLVQVEFQWQKRINKTTNWIRVATPDAGTSGSVGTNRGFVFIPEEGDQVMVNFENGDPDRPYVSASIFPENKSKGGGGSNAVKSIFTRSGIQIVFNDDDGAGSLHISDPSGNTWDMDGHGNIRVNAPETITMTAKNMVVQIEEDIKTNVGRDLETTVAQNVTTKVGQDITTTARQDIKQDSGRKTLIGSGDNTEISANRELDLYGRKQLIGYTDGNTEFGAKEQMHMYGGNSLITALDRIDQKAPKINEVPESGEFIYDQEPRIVSIAWMNEDMTEERPYYCEVDALNLLVQTRGHKIGDTVSVIIKDENGNEIQEGIKELTLTGTVEDDGFARINVPKMKSNSPNIDKSIHQCSISEII